MFRILTVLFIISFSNFAFGQTLEEIVDTYVEKKGGKITLTRLNSMKEIKKVVTTDVTYQTTTIQKGPAYKSTLNYEGIEITACYDGSQGWATNPITRKYEVLEKDDLGDMLNQIEDFPDPIFKSYRNQYELTKGNDTLINGRKCYEISILKPDYVFMKNNIVGKKDFYIDKENYQLVKSVEYNANGKLSIYYSDYKEIDGVQYPHTQKAEINGIPSYTSTTESIELNKRINSALFSLDRQ
ncbi:outer membrane lipoprotein-sorting protein [Arcticibacterium luteifluviistationis]|uniref:Uncharacterized protein TP-0789 domain-containing protein n=1 Tax=Arcticibacterium luteifluviistationis TaxID=1784714 RepID=A0A2Z4GBD8_9BACT|nr:outer membrane lipoprotein-sorting protein [Arcticibacterium luteifluviistationis]AWV98609.1 hypothetical protein DJ013_10685 [Arcticibacterium luteifluviistationis]